LWSGDDAAAEEALDALRRAAADSKRSVADDATVDLARLYAQTGRVLQAYDLADEVARRAPSNDGARQERARLATALGTRLDSRLFFFQDKTDVRIAAVIEEARIALNEKFGIIADASGWHLETAAETLYSARANLGAYARLRFLELETAMGPRFYEHFSPEFGLRAAARATPTRWLSAALTYQYDDIYVDLLQPASISAGIRGHAAHLAADVTLPFRVRVSGRVGTRFLEPDNQSFESTATVMVPVVRPLSLGYNVQYLTWKFNDPSYWSPQAFAAHMFVVRVAQTFTHPAIGYDVQGVIGVAGERIELAPEAGFGPSFGGSGTVTYSVTDRIELRLGLQYAQTVRELPVVLAGSTPTPGAATQPTAISKYWWLLGNTSMLVHFD
jgi:hypothetical protein